MANDSTEIIVTQFAKNRRKSVCVGFSTFENYRLLQIRAWAEKEGADPIPPKSGIPLQVHLIPQLRAVLDEAEAKAHEIGGLDDGPAP